jgi:hypothetical protein
VAEVIARLEQIQVELDAHDGVSAFNGMYLLMTRLIEQRISAGFFADPEMMETLDVVFANLYLDAIDAAGSGAAIATPWVPLFAQRTNSRVEPIQFAIAGLNAHINHDLALAVVASCEQSGTTPSDDVVHQDYLKVNVLLAQIEEEVRQSFLSGVVLEVDRDLSQVVNLISQWSIVQAREYAWTNAEVLWQLRGLAPLRDAYRDSLGRAVGLTSSCLLLEISDLKLT